MLRGEVRLPLGHEAEFHHGRYRFKGGQKDILSQVLKGKRHRILGNVAPGVVQDQRDQFYEGGQGKFQQVLDGVHVHQLETQDQ